MMHPPRRDALPATTEPGTYLAVIEASRGSRNKLKFNPDWNAFQLAGTLPIGMSFPYDFGFVPSTLGDDGDPLDVLVLADEAFVPGTVVECRLAGVVEAEQQDPDAESSERNDRLIAVAEKSHRYRRCRSIADIAENVLDEIESFFVFYNRQKGGRFTPLGRKGPESARAIVERGQARFSNRS